MKITLNDIGTPVNTTTAATITNSNFSTIETAFDNTLSRDGTAPNGMTAPLDMNGHTIVNLPPAAATGEPITFEVFEAALVGHGNLPLGGTTGQVLAKTSNVDYATAWTSESAEITAGTNIAITGGSPATISTITNPTFVSPSITTPTGIVKGDVGLGNVDNTSDATKNAATVTLTNKTIAGSNNTLNVRIGNDVSGLGTGLQTALGVAVGTAGAPVLFNGAGGTPTSIVLTNATGTAASLTSGAATSANNTQILDDTTTNASMFPTWVTTNSGNQLQKVTSTKLTFNPSTGALASTSFSGAGSGLTGTAASLTSGAVITNANLTGDVTSVGNATTLTNAPVIAKVLTGYASGAGTISAADSILSAIQKLNGNNATNANLTGPITSVGNATSIASQTGTGTKFVVDTSPTLVTPVLGVATATTINGVTLDNNAWTTYTPSITAQTGSIPTLITSGRYKQIGKTIFLQVTISVGAGGSASGNMAATLPFSANTSGAWIGSSYEYAVTGNGGISAVLTSATTMTIKNISAATYWVNGYAVAASVTYEIP